MENFLFCAVEVHRVESTHATLAGFSLFFIIINLFCNALILKEGSTFLKRIKECQNTDKIYTTHIYFSPLRFLPQNIVHASPV